MAKLRIQGDSSGYVDLEAPNAASSSTVNVDEIAQTNQANTFTQNQLISGGDAITQEIRSSGNQTHFRMVSDLNNSAWMISNESNAGRMRIMHTNTSTSANTFPMYIYEAGYITMPSQPAFRAGGVSPDGNVTTNISNKLTWATGVAINRGGFYDSAQQRFNAPVAGIYQFSASFWSQGSSAGDFAPKVNGSYLPSGTADSIIFAQQGNGDGIHRNISGTFLLNLNVGDYVELWCRNYTMTFYSGHSWWEGHLVG